MAPKYPSQIHLSKAFRHWLWALVQVESQPHLPLTLTSEKATLSFSCQHTGAWVPRSITTKVTCHRCTERSKQTTSSRFFPEASVRTQPLRTRAPQEWLGLRTWVSATRVTPSASAHSHMNLEKQLCEQLREDSGGHLPFRGPERRVGGVLILAQNGFRLWFLIH